MCFLWTRVFVVWRSAMAILKNRWLEVRVHPLELPTMREALYLSVSFLVIRFLWVCLESVVTAVAYAMFQSVAGWTFWVFCLASHCDGGRSVWNVMVNCYRNHQLAATSPWHPCILTDFFCPLWLRNIESASSQCFSVTVGKRWPCSTDVINWLLPHLDILVTYVSVGGYSWRIIGTRAFFCPLWLRNIGSSSSQCFWVTVGKRWPLFMMVVYVSSNWPM